MSMGWKVYDLGRPAHGNPLFGTGKEKGTKPEAYQKRWFTAGMDFVPPHFAETYSYTFDVARKIVEWRNEWEYQRLEYLTAQGVSRI